MLNGIDPIIIFEFSKLPPATAAFISKIPIVSSIVDAIGLPPIPIYLSETQTGLFIDSEDRNISIETSVETLSNGDNPLVNQKAINSTTTINMVGSKESIGLTLLSAMCDLVIPKVSSKEYKITYLHGAVTIFRGLLHDFSVHQTADDDRLLIKLELVKNNEQKKSTIVEVAPTQTSVDLSSGGGPAGPTAPVSGMQGPAAVPTEPPPLSLAPAG